MQIILAQNKLKYIGLDGRLPWNSKEDLQHFKAMTLGKRLLVGRITYENLPELKDRTMIVVGKGYNTLIQGISQRPDFIIGGAALINSILNEPRYKKLITQVHLSIIDDETEGDVLAPKFTELPITYYHFKTTDSCSKKQED